MSEKKFRVAEIFGPTIQGEGRNAGLPCYFVRLGGCDYRCPPCDSPHAVLPHLVAALPQMEEKEIINTLKTLPKGPQWTVISGGNPGLFDLKLLLAYLLDMGQNVMVETQGTVYWEWMQSVDDLCISPKGPTMMRGMGNHTPFEVTEKFLRNWDPHWYSQFHIPYLKVVVFGESDYDYAVELHHIFPHVEMFLSVGTIHHHMPTVGNPQGIKGPHRPIHEQVGMDFGILAEKMANDLRMRDVKVLPQLHVVAWGDERGR